MHIFKHRNTIKHHKSKMFILSSHILSVFKYGST